MNAKTEADRENGLILRDGNRKTTAEKKRVRRLPEAIGTRLFQRNLMSNYDNPPTPNLDTRPLTPALTQPAVLFV